MLSAVSRSSLGKSLLPYGSLARFPHLLALSLFANHSGGEKATKSTDEIMARAPIRRLRDPSDVLIMLGAVADTILRQELH
jgi:hypothetical protein